MRKPDRKWIVFNQIKYRGCEYPGEHDAASDAQLVPVILSRSGGARLRPGICVDREAYKFLPAMVFLLSHPGALAQG